MCKIKNTMYKENPINKAIQKTLFLPIFVALHERKISFKELVHILNEKGYKYKIATLYSTNLGVNSFIININYFSQIYESLNLDPPTPESLIKAHLKYLSIKEEKKARAEANKAKKQKKVD